MPCTDSCPLEQTPQDARSPGPIGDEELISRAVYDPLHLKRGKLQASIIRAADLFAGELSVWRESPQGFTRTQLVTQLGSNAPAGHTLAEVRAPTAKAIRALRRPEIDGRLFCVVDECATDHAGGHNPAHAHIKICANLQSAMPDTSCELFRAVKESLVFLYRQAEHRVWP